MIKSTCWAINFQFLLPNSVGEIDNVGGGIIICVTNSTFLLVKSNCLVVTSKKTIVYLLVPEYKFYQFLLVTPPFLALKSQALVVKRIIFAGENPHLWRSPGDSGAFRKPRALGPSMRRYTRWSPRQLPDLAATWLL